MLDALGMRTGICSLTLEIGPGTKEGGARRGWSGHPPSAIRATRRISATCASIYHLVPESCEDKDSLFPSASASILLSITYTVQKQYSMPFTQSQLDEIVAKVSQSQ